MPWVQLICYNFFLFLSMTEPNEAYVHVVERKRRSRFDIPPSEAYVHIDSFQASTSSGSSSSSGSITLISSYLDPTNKIVPTTTNTATELQKRLESLLPSCNWTPVEDIKYKQRLKDALHKNFDYIYRFYFCY